MHGYNVTTKIAPVRLIWLAIGVISFGLTIWDCYQHGFGWDCLFNLGAEVVTAAVPPAAPVKIIKFIEKGGKIVKIYKVSDKVYDWLKAVRIIKATGEEAGTVEKCKNLAKILAESKKSDKLVEVLQKIRGKISEEDLDKLARVVNPNDKRTPMLEIVYY